MTQLELLNAMAKAGYKFGRDDEGTYFVHEEIYEVINKFTVTLWGDRIYYVLPSLPGYATPNVSKMTLSVPGYTDSHHIYLEDDDLDIDRIIAGTFHLYSWLS